MARALRYYITPLRKILEEFKNLKISASKHPNLRKNKKKIGSNDDNFRKLEPQPKLVWRRVATVPGKKTV